MERLVIQSKPRHHPWPVVLDEDVGAAGEPREHGARFVIIEIEDNGMFAAVDGVEGGTVAAARAGHAARGIARGRLDFNDTRAHVRQ